MIDKRVQSAADAVADIPDGATVLISGFGDAGTPMELIHALIDRGAKDLTVVNNNAGAGRVGLAALLGSGQVRKIICSYPRAYGSVVFEELWENQAIELETVPQGTLAERMRAAGAGIPAFYTPTSVDTPLSDDKEIREINGRRYVLEYALHADYALVKADTADRWGNLKFRMAARSFGPVMCMAANTTIVQVRNLVDLGEIDPEHVITPGIFVDRVVGIADPVSERQSVARGETYP